jgi:cytochrome c5
MRASCLVFISSLALVAGCGSSVLPRPTSADSQWAAARWPGTDTAALAQGRDLYVRKCAGCHTLYAPAAVVNEQWPANFNEMADRAKLQDEQRVLIERYLVTVTRAPER